MSNLDPAPDEVRCAPRCEQSPQLIRPREVPLGGPRAMTVRRTLPTRERSLIGPWCFIDHYGPDDVARSGGMRVPRHPHTGLATVSWLFSGEIEHTDSAGHQALVHPGSLNLMVAGHGISHSEFSTSQTAVLHGVQLWYALPERTRHGQPSFQAHTPSPVQCADASLRVFLGSVAEITSPVQMHADGLGAEISLAAGGSVELDVDPEHEHGILVDQGAVSAAGMNVSAGELGYLPPGLSTVHLVARRDCRLLLLGGPPFGEEIVMWWNFVARSHEEIVNAREQWQAEISSETTHPGRFGPWRASGRRLAEDDAALPAPDLPRVRLRPRG